MDPARHVATIESGAVRFVTPAREASIVWRAWGAGPPLVLLHGASGSWTHWIRNVLPLAERFRVYVPDMPGFGDSETPPLPHTAEGLAVLVAEAVDSVLPPPQPIDLAGFSFGGIIGGIVAARLGPRVRTLVLLGAGGFGLPRAPMPPLVRVTAEMTPSDIARAHRENLHVLMLADRDRIDELAIHLQLENLSRSRFKSGGIPESDALVKVLPAITARLAGIWGAHDAFVGGDVSARRRVLATRQPDVDFRVVQAGHWVTYEAAHAVNAALLDMLGDRYAEAAGR
jgi:2-hydroxy-6-oxonona-2,4-dienedioate hydrolase